MAGRAPPDPLATYNAKRDFTQTPEPGGVRESSLAGDRFIVQKHAASRLHWDLRLEVDGVLKSWAVTRGPSLDPDDKRLAVRTEDHPLSYAEFEGVIPKGEYGGGTMMLWDRGTWEPVAGKSAADLDEGHLHFILQGERMKGEWLLVRMKPRPGEKRENWLLRKVADPHAGGVDLVERALSSVASGRTMAEIAADRRPRRTFRAGLPTFSPPQLASLADRVPTGNNWLHEIKFDGYRAMIAVAGDEVRVYTRTGLDWTDRFEPLARAVAALDLPPALIDGEITAPDEHGNPSFSALQAVLKRRGRQPGAQTLLEFHAFDLLSLEGEDLRPLPTIERKERLDALLAAAAPPIRVADHVIGAGEALYRAMCEAGLEGIISKRVDAPYRGDRTRSWLKVKCTRRQEFVIIGWTTSSARGRPFASLLLAQHEGDRLIYKGKVGAGFSGEVLDELASQMKPLATTQASAEVPRAEARGSNWIKPTLVAEVGFAEMTADGRVRHGSFIGLRSDKVASEVRPERATPAPPPEGKVSISSGDRVIFPESGRTKGDLADYYERLAPLMLAHMANRPISLVRCPQGRAKKCFFQRHDSGGFSDHVQKVPIREKDGSTEDYLFIDDAAGILSCVQMGTIEFHGWGARADDVERPERMVFDLDPDEGLGFPAVKQAAQDLRRELQNLGLTSFAMLSGGKGVHIVVPLTPGHDWEAHKDFAKRFAEALSMTEPERFVATMSKAKRKGKIFIDYLRNQRGSTAVMPYSARARAGAPVAAPITWEELNGLDGAGHWTIEDAEALVSRAASKALRGWGFAAQALPGV